MRAIVCSRRDRVKWGGDTVNEPGAQTRVIYGGRETYGASVISSRQYDIMGRDRMEWVVRRRRGEGWDVGRPLRGLAGVGMSGEDMW
ncbi:hypothetical protein O988_09070 [Pseudogymnoascus sp. VKM F-3808]|nr:hypothetical protein O988_09070 [Pseudogymnoascus sp. VKM F-3808]